MKDNKRIKNIKMNRFMKKVSGTFACKRKL